MNQVKAKKKYQSKEFVTLKLSIEHAEALKDVLGSITGRGRRHLTSDIFAALVGVEIRPYYDRTTNDKIVGSLSFEDK